uniref:Glucuronosyltransferase n=1 Tax=Panagrellus redivivus TaxID=6233 RepID=A0A7E4ZYG1_PANRE
MPIDIINEAIGIQYPTSGGTYHARQFILSKIGMSPPSIMYPWPITALLIKQGTRVHLINWEVDNDRAWVVRECLASLPVVVFTIDNKINFL